MAHAPAEGHSPSGGSRDLGSRHATGDQARRENREPVPYHEYRAQEPPQARLLRLRGLFDTLLDRDSSTALAGGRAKREWTKRASLARYGAGGSLAMGSLAGRTAPAAPQQEGAPQSQGQSQGGHAVSVHPREWFSGVRRQSYATELLARCRTCRADMERAWLEAEHAPAEARPGTATTNWRSWLQGLHGQSQPSTGTHPGAHGVESRSWGRLLLLANERLPAAEDHPPDATAAHRMSESGWKGSRVWGVSASHAPRATETHKPKDTKTGDGTQGEQFERQREIEWEGFLAYAEVQERDLYALFNELDRNHDGQLDEKEVRNGFERAGIHLNKLMLDDFIASMASSSGNVDIEDLRRGQRLYITFPEFRDYLLLLPRKPTMAEIFRFYQVRKAIGLFGTEGIFAQFGSEWGKTARGASAVNPDLDVSIAAEETQDTANAIADEKGARKAERRQYRETAEGAAPPTRAAPAHAHAAGHVQKETEALDEGEEEEEEEDEDTNVFRNGLALKFLLAGGIAGAVSRTATAPLDRLKVYLITSIHDPEPGIRRLSGLRGLMDGVVTLYRQGGLHAFWVGNGLNCIKIFPESAIKFLSYETSKRMFAKYVDHVSDSRDISGLSRFLSGGIGGITSQLAIYPVETLKTRLMSSETSRQNTRGMAFLGRTATEMYKQGGVRAFYRGLGAGLVGVFPYSAIDMSTFEGIKLFYIRYTGHEDPGVFSLLAFGSISGSVGATTVYPLNLVRTRMQASGTPGHPTMYVCAARRRN